MDRRQLLSGTAAGAAIALGGCLSSGDSGSDDNSEPEGSESNDEALEESSDHLEEALDRMGEEADIAFETDPGNPINTSAIEISIEDAEDALDKFEEEEANDEQLTAYDSLSASIEFTKAVLDVLLELESSLEAYDTAVSYEDNERYSDAVDQLETAREHSENAASLLEDADDAWEDVEATDGDSELDIADTKDELDEVADIIDAYNLLIEAAINFDTGLGLYIEGLDLFEQERYGDSSSTFYDATFEFESAAEEYRSGESEVSSSFRDTFIDMTCFSEALLESSELYGDSAAAAEDGEYQTAEDRAIEAEEALDAGCGGSI